jgi:HSP20 family protein
MFRPALPARRGIPASGQFRRVDLHQPAGRRRPVRRLTGIKAGCGRRLTNAHASSLSMEDHIMAETATRLPIRSDDKAPATTTATANWRPFEDLRREVDRLFDDFGRGSWLRPWRGTDLEPLFRRTTAWTAPAVDIAEKADAYEITAELPGLDVKNVDVSLRNGALVIKGEKEDSKEEKSRDYYLRERQYGTFERSFAIPSDVDASKIAATFKNGVLTVALPKSAEAQKAAKKVEIKAA